MIWQLAQAYPGATAATIFAPMLGAVLGLVAAWGGYENLKHQFASDEQAHRIEDSINAIRDKNMALENTTALLKGYEERLATSGKRDELLSALVGQYQRLSHATALFATMTRRDMSQEQGKIAIEILSVLNQDVVRTTVRDDLPGRPLIIGLEPNTYRVIFSVPMRVTPTLTFTGLPSGTIASVSSASEIGFTVTFFPLSTPVRSGEFGITADARL